MDRLLIVLERDVGLFSMVDQVLNTVALLERHQVERTPVVLLGRDITYFDPDGYDGRTTVWEYYFEPLVEAWPAERVLTRLGDRALDLLASRRLLQEHIRISSDLHGERHAMQRVTVADLANLKELSRRQAALDWQWTDAYMPSVDGKTLDRPSDRGERARLLREWIRPRRQIRAKVEALHAAELGRRYVIGVHVRGTDSLHVAHRQSDLKLEPFFAAVDARLAEIGGERCRVLLASDDQAYVVAFRERYDALCVSYDSVRSRRGDPHSGAGPTGQLLPGFLSQNDGRAVVNGADVVVEFSLLCRSDYLIHNGSSVATIAACLVADDLRI